MQLQIGPEEESMTIGQYLKKLGFSDHQISRLKFRENGICVDGVRQRVTKRLRTGERLEIRPEYHREGTPCLELSADPAALPVLYEDEDLLIVNKPSGLVCHPSHGHYRDTLANQAASYGREKGEQWTIRIVGRLDKDTSGIVAFAKNAEAASLLARQRARGDMKKTYLGLVQGSICPPGGCIRTPIARDGTSLMKMKADPSGKPAKTWYQVIEEKAGVSLVRIQIEHGRTHQIRVHMASVGHPLVGDPLYGEKSDGCKAAGSTALHAWKLELMQPFSGERLLIKAPLPEWCADFGEMDVFDKSVLL